MIKNKKLIILITISILLITVSCIYFVLSDKSDKSIYYSGKNDMANVKITGYKDYNEFYENMPSSIISYDDRKEFSKKEYGFIGEIKFSNDIFVNESEYNLKLISENDRSLNIILLVIDKKPENGFVTVPFVFYDLLDSKGKMINRAVLTKDGKDMTTVNIKY